MSGYRPVYTTDEDVSVLNMIINTNSYYRVRGKAFWDDLSNMGVVDRTWQSLKERFEKHILPRINDARYTIPAFEKKKIELAIFQLSRQNPNSDDEDNDFDDDENEDCNEDGDVSDSSDNVDV